MIAFYAAFYLILTTNSSNGGIQVLPFNSLIDCEASAKEVRYMADNSLSGPTIRAFCVQGNSIDASK